MSLFLAGLLVRGGVLTPEAVEEALQRQNRQGGALDTNLLELGVADEGTLAIYLARASGLPIAPRDQLASPPPAMRRLLPLRLAERHGVVPFANEDREVHLACVHPMEATHLDEMALLLSQRIVAYVAPEVWIREAIARLYDEPIPPRFADLLEQLGRGRGDIGSVAPRHGGGEAARGEALRHHLERTPGPFDPSAGPAIAPTPGPLAAPRPLSPMPTPAAPAGPSGDPAAPAPPIEARGWAGPPEAPELQAGAGFATGEAETSTPGPFRSERPSSTPGPAGSAGETIPPGATPGPFRRERASSVTPGPANGVAGPDGMTARLEDASLPPPSGKADGMASPAEPAAASSPAEPAAAPTPAAPAARPTSPPALGIPPAQSGSAATGIGPGAPSPQGSEWEHEAGGASRAGAPKTRGGLKLSMEDALSWLASASGRDEALDILLRFTISHFPFAATLVVQGERLAGWDAWGHRGDDAERIRTLQLPLDRPSALQMATETGGRFLGPLQAGDLATKLGQHLDRPPPVAVLIQPITIAGRTVALLYAESEEEGSLSSQANLVMQVAQAVGRKLEQLIHARKAAEAIASRALDPASTESPAPSEDARPDPEAAAVPRLSAVDLCPLERLAMGSKGVERLLAARTEREMQEAVAALAPFGGIAAALLVSLLPGEGSRKSGLSGTNRVVAALELLGDAALPALRLAAASPSPLTRYEVARLIRRRAKNGADPTLIVLSGDEDPKVAAAARGEAEAAPQPKAVR